MHEEALLLGNERFAELAEINHCTSIVVRNTLHQTFKPFRSVTLLLYRVIDVINNDDDAMAHVMTFCLV